MGTRESLRVGRADGWRDGCAEGVDEGWPDGSLLNSSVVVETSRRRAPRAASVPWMLLSSCSQRYSDEHGSGQSIHIAGAPPSTQLRILHVCPRHTIEKAVGETSVNCVAKADDSAASGHVVVLQRGDPDGSCDAVTTLNSRDVTYSEASWSRVSLKKAAHEPHASAAPLLATSKNTALEPLVRSAADTELA